MIYMSIQPPKAIHDVFRRASRDNMLSYLAPKLDEAHAIHNVPEHALFGLYVDGVLRNMQDKAQLAAREAGRRTDFSDIVVAISPLGEFTRGPERLLADDFNINRVRKAAVEAAQSYTQTLLQQWPDLARKSNQNIF